MTVRQLRRSVEAFGPGAGARQPAEEAPVKVHTDPAPRVTAAPTGGRILLVDGSPMRRETMAHRLGRNGFSMAQAASGQGALEALARERFDMVLLDLGLPDVAAGALVKAIRGHFSALELPIIAVTERADDDDIVEVLALGANDYMAHPLDFPLAVARIRMHLRLHGVTRKLEEANERLRHFSYVDALTDVANRRRFDEFMEEHWARAARSRSPLSLVLVDLDGFKEYNDAHGHPAGDEALRLVAKTLAANLHRGEDLLARYGGDEFAVVLPGVSPEGAVVVAERLRAAVADLRLEIGRATDTRVTLSAGVVGLVPVWSAAPALLIDAADRALYRAKREGKNRVCRHGPGDTGERCGPVQ